MYYTGKGIKKLLKVVGSEERRFSIRLETKPLTVLSMNPKDRLLEGSYL